ncbi:hypothetical protein [Acrocarpospora macrocephala]|uniref:hypothetical protein n=1 Tax=Acrocarpospora macrocephala TaxID=150177 RepID=UPI0012D37118|nr:hypothetical protein [Acrocarpospora macrocephala]
MLTSASAPPPRTVRSECPQQWGGREPGGWVPAAAKFDGVDEFLVPGIPVAATICAYPGDNTRPGRERLAGSRVLVGGAGAMARDLAYLPISDRSGLCTLMGGPMTNYLIRFDYPGGFALWVGTAEEVNACVVTTNGTAGSRSYVGRSITAAYRTGAWKLIRPEDPCQGDGGRRGQGEHMVPGEPASVVVCRSASGTKPAAMREHGAAEARSLAAALNAQDSWPTDHGCQGGSGLSYRLMFRYADGPPASVHLIVGCDPPIGNPLLQGDLDDVAYRHVLRLAPPE